MPAKPAVDFGFDAGLDRSGTSSVKLDERLAKFGHADVIPLWVADMDFASPPCVVDAIARRAAHPAYAYTILPDGMFQATTDWCRTRYDWPVEREWIVFSPGTLPALAASVAAFTQPDDAVVIQPPVYGHFADAVTGAGRKLALNPLREQAGQYTLDLDDLDARAKDGAKALLLCNPHNPVGRVWNRDELAAMLKVSRKHGMVVVSDDIHADITYPGATYVPLGALAGPDDAVVTAISPSKTFNLQGLALTALIVPNAKLRKRLRRELTARQLINFNPFSLAAAQAAWSEGGPWCEALVAYLATTRDAVTAFVNTRLAPMRVVSPEASYLMWLDCRELHLDDAALRSFFIDDCGLGLNPGTDFIAGGSGFMRLNIASPRAHIMDALTRIHRALANTTHANQLA